MLLRIEHAIAGLLLLFFSSFAYGQYAVLVSIIPQKFLVEAIGGEQVSVDIIVPRGADAHHYEPTPKQIRTLSAGALWFRIGETFEPRLLSLCRHMQVIDQRVGCDLIMGSCCSTDAADPHIWLSPRLLQIQAKQIADALSSYDPDHAPLYHARLQAMEARLIQLDQEVSTLLAHAPKTILVSHPAFGYLCRDHGITQLAIEREGHEPTPRYLSDLLNHAREAGIKTLFLHSRNFGKSSAAVAQALDAQVVYLDPYAEELIESITTIAKAFSS